MLKLKVGSYYYTSDSSRFVRITSIAITPHISGHLLNKPQKVYVGHFLNEDGTDTLMVCYFNENGDFLPPSGLSYHSFKLKKEIITDLLYHAQGTFYAIMEAGLDTPESNKGIFLEGGVDFLFASYEEALEEARDSRRILKLTASPATVIPECVKKSIALHKGI